MAKEALALSQQSLLIGSSNSLLIAERLNKISADLIVRLQGDTTSIDALSELFSPNSPARYGGGKALILECFPNDVVMAQSDRSKQDGTSERYALLGHWLAASGIVSRLVLINLWPAALKTKSLASEANQIGQQRDRILHALSPWLDCDTIDIGRDTTAFDDPNHPEHLNSAGLEHYEQCLRSLIAEPACESSNERPADAGDDSRPRTRPSTPLLHLNAATMATSLSPIQPLETFSSILGTDVYLPLSDAIEVHPANGTGKTHLLSLSYLATEGKNYISIRNSHQHYCINTTSGSTDAAKRVVPLPMGTMPIQAGEPLIIELSRLAPEGAQELQANDRALITPGQISPRSTNRPGQPGLFGLTFDTDRSNVRCRRADPRNSPQQHPDQCARSQSKTRPTKKKIGLFSVGMWPGYRVSQHPCFDGLPGVEVTEAASPHEADAILVGVFPDCKDLDKQYQALAAQTDRPLIFYTNEHSSEGILPGIDQLDFNKYYACLSHYSVTHPQHVWSPMAVNWYGWTCDDMVFKNQRQSLASKPLNSRIKQAIFCYSNDSCDHRNRTAEHLIRAGFVHSCGGHLNNCGGKTAPRDDVGYREYCSAFKGYMAFENSSFPGYLTEKILLGLMAGCKTFYWGDATIDHLFSERHCLNLTGLSARESARLIHQELLLDEKDDNLGNPFKPAFRERLMDARNALAKILLSLV